MPGISYARTRERKHLSVVTDRCRKNSADAELLSTAALRGLTLGHGTLAGSRPLLLDHGAAAGGGSCLALAGNIATPGSFRTLAGGNTTARGLLAGSHGRARDIGRNRSAGGPDGSSQRLTLVINAVIAPLLINEVLTVCGVDLVDIGYRIRVIMIPHIRTAVTGGQKARHHDKQTGQKLTDTEHKN